MKLLPDQKLNFLFNNEQIHVQLCPACTIHKVGPFVLHFALFQPAVSGHPSSVGLILDDLSFPARCDCLAMEAGFYYAVAGS